mgnify:CR=1 FL=1
MALYDEAIATAIDFWTERIAVFQERYLGMEQPDRRQLAREFERLLDADELQSFYDQYGAEETNKQVARLIRRNEGRE